MRRLIAIFCLVPLAGATSWIRVSSSGGEVVTDASPAVALTALRDIEFLRSATPRWFERQPDRIRVFLPVAESLFRDFRADGNTQGVAHSRGGEDWIIAYASNPDWRRILKHEYIHLLLGRTAIPWPAWAEEGQAEFYSTLRVDGGRLRVGDPVPGHLRAPLDRALDLSRAPSEADGGLFYAQSWALVHYLLTAPAHKGQWDEFRRLLASGDPAAVESAFGRGLPDLLRRALPLVPRATGFGGTPAPPTSAISVRSEALPAVEAGLLRAQLLLETGNAARGEDLIRRLAREHPRSPSAVAALAALDRDRAALRALAEAAPDNAAVLFDLATMLREERSPEAGDLLRRVAVLNPRHAEAHHLLGLMASESRRWEEAAAHLRRAAQLRPRQASWWHALAFAEWKANRVAEAREAARRAAAFAATPAEQAMATALLNDMGAPAATAPAVPGDRVRTPSSWVNGEDARIEGLLTRVHCQDGGIYLTIASDRERLTLQVRDPRLVQTPSGLPFEFRCGAPERPAKVSAGYVRQTLTLTSIELL
ncbi:MAG: hypothetical protein K2X35_25190 [Bryobacteraceae bacterium]|nr:hypothetical protein [Bryobacteraceae bacterium]